MLFGFDASKAFFCQSCSYQSSEIQVAFILFHFMMIINKCLTSKFVHNIHFDGYLPRNVGAPDCMIFISASCPFVSKYSGLMSCAPLARFHFDSGPWASLGAHVACQNIVFVLSAANCSSLSMREILSKTSVHCCASKTNITSNCNAILQVFMHVNLLLYLV